MEPIYLSIQQKETGSRIKSLLRESGYTVRDIQNAMGFENPQAVYKWISGKCLPSLDNFLILSRLLNTSIEDILVIDGDIPRFRSKYREIRERLNRWYNDKIVILWYSEEKQKKNRLKRFWKGKTDVSRNTFWLPQFRTYPRSNVCRQTAWLCFDMFNWEKRQNGFCGIWYGRIKLDDRIRQLDTNEEEPLILCWTHGIGGFFY